MEERPYRSARSERTRHYYEEPDDKTEHCGSIFTVELILCIIAILMLLIIKLTTSDFYGSTKSLYYNNINKDFNWKTCGSHMVYVINTHEKLGFIKKALPKTFGKTEQVSATPDSLPTSMSNSEASDKLIPPEGCSFAPFFLTAKPISPLKNYKITSDFGYRSDPKTGNVKFHSGIDLAAPHSTDIMACLPGKVVYIGDNQYYGKYIILDHGNNIETLYAHCDEIVAPLDVVVRQGDTIAKVGTTGDSTGDHVHFEIHIDKEKLDPYWLFLFK